MYTIPKARLLEYNEGEFQGNKYSNIVARFNDQLLKFKLDRKVVSDCSEAIDSDVEIKFDIVKGQNSAASIKVIEVNQL